MNFLRLMFKQSVSHLPPQPDEYSINSISSAVFSLQKCSGMQREYLGKRLGLTRAKMIHLESYGKPNQAILERLKLLAQEYDMDVLTRYFEKQVLLVQAHRRKKLHEIINQ